MVRILLGSGLEQAGEKLEVSARTLEGAIEMLERDHGWARETELRWFVNGTEAARLEGTKTPVGDEDHVLVTDW